MIQTIKGCINVAWFAPFYIPAFLVSSAWKSLRLGWKDGGKF